MNSGEVSKGPAEDIAARQVSWKTSEVMVNINTYTPQMIIRGSFSKSQNIWLED
jgi:hypothetical protein